MGQPAQIQRCTQAGDQGSLDRCGQLRDQRPHAPSVALHQLQQQPKGQQEPCSHQQPFVALKEINVVQQPLART